MSLLYGYYVSQVPPPKDYYKKHTFMECGKYILLLHLPYGNHEGFCIYFFLFVNMIAYNLLYTHSCKPPHIVPRICLDKCSCKYKHNYHYMKCKALLLLVFVEFYNCVYHSLGVFYKFFWIIKIFSCHFFSQIIIYI